MRRARRSHAPARARLVLAWLAAIAAAVLLAGCGGGGGGTTAAAVSDGAQLAPAGVPVFVEVDTDAGGLQWRRADALLDRLPTREQLLGTLRDRLDASGLDWERDVRPVLGDRLYAVRLDPGRKGEEVGYTRPADQERFEHLLDRLHDPGLVHRSVDGWTVFAESHAALDRFQELRSSAPGTLADQDWFRRASGSLPDPALARVFVDGSGVRRALEESLSGTLGRSLVPALGELQYAAAAIAAGTEGVSITGTVAVENAPTAEAFSPGLPARIPSGALVYAGFGDVRAALKRALDTAEQGNLAFSLGRAAVEAALGLSVEDDVLPLFDREGAVAAYPGAGAKGRAALYLRVDGAKARSLLDRLGRADLGALGTEVQTRTLTVAGTDVLEVRYPEQDLRLLAAVTGDVLVVTGDEETLRDSLDGGPSLADDAGYRRLRSLADVPSEVTALVYADVAAVAAEHERARDEVLSPEARETLAALGPLLLYAEGDGSERSVHGLLAVG